MMAGEAVDRKPGRGRRAVVAVVAVLGAFGVLSAIGTNIVNDLYSDVSRWVSGDDPLRVNVRDAVGANDGFTMATWSPRPIEGRGEAIDGCESLLATAKKAGAARVGTSISDLLIEGGTDRDVTIVDLRAKIVDRRAPMHGAEFHCESAGAVAGIGVSFDFDEPQPVARLVSDDADDGTPYFAKGDVIVLKQGEIQPIQITATASRDEYVAWDLEVDLVVDGASETITIDEGGEPFQITPGQPNADFKRYYEWLWFESPQRLYESQEPFHP